MGCPPGRTWPRVRAVAFLCVDLTQSSETGAAIGTMYQGKGRECGEVRIGKTGRSSAQGGERQRGTATYGGKGCNERARGSGEGQLVPPASDNNPPGVMATP